MKSKIRYALIATVWTTAVMMPVTGRAQNGDLAHRHPALPDAAVDFGVLPTGPLGPEPCLQTGAIGGPADPCSYKIHHLTPEEVTIVRGGEVSFQVHGGGHAMALYKVSRDTTRDQVGQFLCPGEDPGTIEDPALHPCNLSAAQRQRRSRGRGWRRSHRHRRLGRRPPTSSHPCPSSGQPGVVCTGQAHVGWWPPVSQSGNHSRRSDFKRPADYVSLPHARAATW